MDSTTFIYSVRMKKEMCMMEAISYYRYFHHALHEFEYLKKEYAGTKYTVYLLEGKNVISDSKL